MIRINQYKIEIILIIISIISIFFLWHQHIADFYLNVAWGGFSPIGWIAERNNPANFAKGFPTGLVGHYEKSLTMYLYIIGSKITSTIVVSYFVMLMEILSLFLLGYVFSIKFSKKENIILKTFIIGCVLGFSCARNFDWGRWGQPFIVGQFYTFADVFRALSFIYIVTSDYTKSGIFSALAICTHPLMGLTGVAGNIFFSVKELLHKKRHILLAIGIPALISIIWFLLFFRKAAINSNNTIPTTDWFYFSQLLSSHFYPTYFGVFTKYFYRYVIPFISFSACFFVLLYQSEKNRQYLKNFVWFYLGIMSIVIIGIINSHFHLSPVIIKLAPQRANEFILLIGVPLICLELLNLIKKGRWLQKFSALFILITLFFPFAKWSILAAILLMISCREISKKVTLAFIIFVIGIFLFYYSKGFFTDPFYTLVGPIKSKFNVICFISLFIVIAGQLLKKERIALFWAFALTIYGAFYYVNDSRLSKEDKKLFSDFYEAQLWARQNSQAQDSFMVDPTIFYGWRDFSERSSYGNIREWLHTSWLYDSKFEIYQVGIRRAQEFGVNLYNYSDSSELYKDIRTAFYSKPSELMKINACEKNFMVGRNQYLNQQTILSDLEQVYKNDSFSIFKNLNCKK